VDAHGMLAGWMSWASYHIIHTSGSASYLCTRPVLGCRFKRRTAWWSNHTSDCNCVDRLETKSINMPGTRCGPPRKYFTGPNMVAKSTKDNSCASCAPTSAEVFIFPTFVYSKPVLGFSQTFFHPDLYLSVITINLYQVCT